MNVKNFFASLVMLAALASVGFAQPVVSASSCPNQVSFGAHPGGPADTTVRARVDVTYFMTDDPNIFISERAGVHRSASNTVQGTEQFMAALGGMGREGLASIQKRQSSSTYRGEMAALNPERDSVNVNGGMVNANTAQVTAGPTLYVVWAKPSRYGIQRSRCTGEDAPSKLHGPAWLNMADVALPGGPCDAAIRHRGAAQSARVGREFRVKVGRVVTFEREGLRPKFAAVGGDSH